MTGPSQETPSAPRGEAADLGDYVLTLTRDLLERNDVTLDDDFFSMGGDSIVAMHLVGQIARRLGLRVQVTMLFANPRLADFVAGIERLQEEAEEAAGAPDDASLTAALAAARRDEGMTGAA
ncbi:acyl carrier protein [Micromonospora sp. NPDC051925]|uniref:acyl carrier protein n=1 Tax=Micromonospora sp. NPDC051925 TaxID=3364288 RepID=UPI0037C81A79